MVNWAGRVTDMPDFMKNSAMNPETQVGNVPEEVVHRAASLALASVAPQSFKTLLEVIGDRPEIPVAGIAVQDKCLLVGRFFEAENVPLQEKIKCLMQFDIFSRLSDDNRHVLSILAAEGLASSIQDLRPFQNGQKLQNPT